MEQFVKGGRDKRMQLLQVIEICLCACSIATVSSGQNINISSEEYVEVVLGDTLTIQFRMDCNFSCLKSFDIFYYHLGMQSKRLQCWINFDEEMSLDVHDCANKRQQIAWKHTSSQQDNAYVYVSSNITTLRDIGNYSLKFVTGDFEITRFVYLFILAPPRIIQVKIGSALVLDEEIVKVVAKQLYSFCCSTTLEGTTPATDLTWIYNDTYIQRVKIKSVQTLINDGFLYQTKTYLNLTADLQMNNSIVRCSAFHKGLDGPINKQFTLKIHVPPTKIEIMIHRTVIKNGHTMILHRGNKKQISCTSFSISGDITMKWFLDAKPLSNNITLFTSNKQNPNLFNSMIVISSTQLEDMSDTSLTCSAGGMGATLNETVWIRVHDLAGDLEVTGSNDTGVYSPTGLPRQETFLKLVNILISAVSLILTPFCAFAFFLAYKKYDGRSKESRKQRSRRLPDVPYPSREEIDVMTLQKKLDSCDGDMYESISEDDFLPTSLSRIDKKYLSLNTKMKGGLYSERWIASLFIPYHRHSTVFVHVLGKGPSFLPPPAKDQFSTALKLYPHGNIVSFLAVCEDVDKYYLVQEFASRGSLQSFLESQISKTATEREYIVTVFQKCVIDILNAMEYLLSNKCSHPGLGARKVLLSDTTEWKLYDFCSQTMLPVKINQLTEKVKRVGIHLPPETLQRCQYTAASDVWSIGVVMLEVLTKNSPMKKEPIQVLQNQWQGFQSESFAASLYNICGNCLSPEPSVRPSLERLKFDIQNAVVDIKEMSDNGQSVVEQTKSNQHHYLEMKPALTRESSFINDAHIYCHNINEFQPTFENSGK